MILYLFTLAFTESLVVFAMAIVRGCGMSPKKGASDVVRAVLPARTNARELPRARHCPLRCLLKGPCILTCDGAQINPEGGYRITRLDQILLNGNNVCMLVPGGDGPVVVPDEQQ